VKRRKTKALTHAKPQSRKERKEKLKCRLKGERRKKQEGQACPFDIISFAN